MTLENRSNNQNMTDEQPTILSLSKAVRLTRCKREDCNCGFNIHCPFCDKVHFKPTTVNKVRDHLEFRHFAYAVQFGDTTVVKCFRKCKEKASGHYHCPVCTSMILKRNAFVEHLRKHAKVMGKGVGIVVALDSKHPKQFLVAGHVIILCDKDCSESKHYHCPICEYIVDDRSLMITHIWRCEESKDRNKIMPRFDINQDEEFNFNSNISHPKEAKTEVQHWHQSIVRNMKDLPIQKCTEENCCDGKYHCPLCTKERFKPTFYSHLLGHYVAHWKKRIPYNNYSILICTQNCELTHERTNKSIIYHYHCPVCGETKRRRASFIHHLKICQGDRYLTHRYSMKRIENISLEDENRKITASNEGSKVEVHVVTTIKGQDVEENFKSIITNINEGDSNILVNEPEDREMFTSDETVNTPEKPLTDNVVFDDAVENTVVPGVDEVFQTVTAVLSWEFLQKISVDHEILDSILENISKCSETSVSSSPGTVSPVYVVSGQPENLIKFKDMIKKVQGKGKENDNQELPLEDVAEIRSETHEADTSGVNSSSDVSLLSSPIDKKVSTSSCIQKTGRGRPRKIDNIQITNTDEKDSESKNSYKHSLRYSSRKTRVDFSAMVKGKKKFKDVLQKENIKEHDFRTKSLKHDKKSKKYDRNVREKYFVKTLSSKHSQTDLTESDSEESDGFSSDEMTMTAMENVDDSVNCEVNSTDQMMFVPSVCIDEIKTSIMNSRSKNTVKTNFCLSMNENDQNKINEDSNSCNEINGDSQDPQTDCQMDMEQIKCDLCELNFEQQSDLQGHLSSVHGPKELHQNFPCSKCDKTFTNEKSLTVHISKVHQNILNQDFTQRLINSKAKSKRDSNNTIDLKRIETPVCEICGKIFSQQQHLFIHKQAVHLKSKKAVCDLCGKHFDHIRYLKAHMKRHAGIKKHACNQCNLSFIESNSLRLHMQTHLDPEQRSYKIICKFCGKKFVSKTNYKDHLNKHTGDKPYECDLCGRKFGFKSMIDKHKLFKHSDDKPFKCTNCPKAFKMKRLLDQHMVTHTRESKYTCNNCNKPFSCKNTMKVHIPKCKRANWTQKVANSAPAKTVLLYTDNLIPFNPSNEEGIVLNSVVPIETDTKTDLITITSEVDGGQTSIKPEILMGTENVIVNSDSVVLGTTENVVIDTETIPMEASDVALFLCSECNAVFENWNLAEQHISMCHTENLEDIMQISSGDVQGQAVDIITTAVQE